MGLKEISWEGMDQIDLAVCIENANELSGFIKLGESLG